MLTKEYVEELLEYHPQTGDFVWRVSRGTVKPGKKAGCIHSSGYVKIRIDKKGVSAHHLVWLMETGQWPQSHLDHIDGNGSNNHYSNLRECTISQNKANSRRYKNNTTGIKSVFWNKRYNKWMTSIQVKGERKFLGYFGSKEEAAMAYANAAKQHFGEFARLS